MSRANATLAGALVLALSTLLQTTAESFRGTLLMRFLRPSSRMSLLELAFRPPLVFVLLFLGFGEHFLEPVFFFWVKDFLAELPFFVVVPFLVADFLATAPFLETAFLEAPFF